MCQYKNFRLDESVRENIPSILEFLLPLYEKKFGSSYIYGEDCTISNSCLLEYPQFELSELPVRIRLCLTSTQYWCQAILQLSHELCHYTLRQYRLASGYSSWLSWFEEIIATAFSWYALQYSADNWSRCKLSQASQPTAKYTNSLSEYLRCQQERAANRSFAACNTSGLLVQYDIERKAEMDRQSQLVEIRTVFHIFANANDSLHNIGNYYLYRSDDGVTIDFDQWHHDTNDPIILALKSIQPVKLPVQCDS